MICNLTTNRRLASGAILPNNPDFEQWIDRVNAGARFRLDARAKVYGPAGEPFLRLTPARARVGEASYTLAELALYLYHRNVGAVLTDSEDIMSIAEPGNGSLPLSFGDIVDFLQVGTLLDRIPCTPPWGYSYGSRVSVQPLDDLALPRNTRVQLEWLFEPLDLVQFGISLVVNEEGLQTYWISYKTSQPLLPETVQAIANRACWYLPRYAAVVVDWVEDGDVIGYPLWANAAGEEDTKEPHYSEDPRAALLQLFAETVQRQLREIAPAVSFQYAEIPIGPTAEFELGCYNLVFLQRELQRFLLEGQLTDDIVSSCITMITHGFSRRYSEEALNALVQERLDYYRHEIETKWDEDESSWELLLNGLSEDLRLRIISHHSRDELDFKTPTHLDLGMDDLDLRISYLAMEIDLANSSLTSTVFFVYILRHWFTSGRILELTPTELDEFAVQGVDEAEALLALQAQQFSQNDEEEDDLGNDLSQAAYASLLHMIYRNRPKMIAYGVERLKEGHAQRAAWSGEMIKQFGTSIKPYLSDLWKATHNALAS